MTEKDKGVQLAEAQQQRQSLERELTIVEARIRTLAAEVLAEARRDRRMERRSLRVPPYADGRPVEDHAEDAHVLINSPTVRWPRHSIDPPGQ